MVMSRSSLVVRGPLRPSLWTKDSQVVLDSKAPITSALATLGSSLHYREKRRMYPRRVSSAFWWQFLGSHMFLGCLYVPWKFPTKISLRSAQL